ncbi:DUF2285 domain-containing protein [Mesorhizobium sp. M0977]|uniref:DNA -binding domain-containing protein n=1 Tax=Mesorhizobium sp. M0977 TaxID=2957039 RepID=UPI003338B030
MTQEAFLDHPPESEEITKYDREHMKLYVRLLDAAADGADWHEVVSILFNLKADLEPERARRVYDTHLARARWMTEHGYRKLVREGRH